MRAGELFAERFELAAPTGRGGMGLVWRAFDRLSGRDVALKVMLRGDTPEDEQEALVRFRREVAAHRLLSHPAIVSYLADGVVDGSPWLASEWVEGIDLSERLRRGPIALYEVVELGVRLAEALGAVHAAGMLHRDLKPGNIRLEQGDIGRARLLDFGVTRAVAGDPFGGLTIQGALVGTPGFMSPEQARGESNLDERSDLFSLGCVLYTCVAGVIPFRGDTPMARLAKLVFEDPPPLRSRRPECSEALAALITRMLGKERTVRPSSAIEVAAALRALHDGTASTPRPVAAVGGFGRREQVWVCVMLVEGVVRNQEHGPSDDDDRTKVDEAAPLLRALAAGPDLQVELLRNGALVVGWRGDSAVDTARRAARQALQLLPVLGSGAKALAAGHATVGTEGPIGDAVDRAAALLSTSSGMLLVDEALAQLLGDEFELTRESSRAILVGERRTASSTARTLLGRPTPCLGREVELSTLDAILQEVRDEQAPAAVLLLGELGVGKSRVLHEWVRRARRKSELSVWHAQGDVTRLHAPFGVVTQLVRDACGVEPFAEKDLVRARIASTVAGLFLAPDRERVASRLCELCGAPWAGKVDAALMNARRDPIAMGDQVSVAWEDFLVAACATRPLVVVIEDLQWADPSSLSLIDRALRNFPDRPWMVLGVGRSTPEDRARPFSDHAPREIVIAPLQRLWAERLVRAALGPAVSKARVDAIVDRAGGNPYFLEELVRAEAEGHGDETPVTVLAMSEARLLRIDDVGRRALRAASVYGVRFDERGIDAILGESSSATLAALVGDEWLARLAGHTFTFRQATTRDAAYAMLLDDDKRLAHRRAAGWLASEGEPDAATVADHFQRAGMPEKAALWWAEAAEQALEANDFRASIAHADAAERCGASGPVLSRALTAQGDALHWLGEVRPRIEVATKLLEAARSDPTYIAEAMRHQTQAAVRLGDGALVADAIARTRQLLRLHPEVDAVVLGALRVSLAGRAGGLRDAQALGDEAERAPPVPIGERPPLLRATAVDRRASLASFDDFEGAAELSIAASKLYRAAGDVRRALQSAISGGDSLVSMGAPREGLGLLETALLEARRLGLSDAAARANLHVALALSMLGRHTEAARAAGAAVDTFMQGGNAFMECWSRCALSRVLLATGLVDPARTQALRATSLLAPDHHMTMYARADLADALLSNGPPSDPGLALEHARAARLALRDAPDKFVRPSKIFRVFIDALEANGHREDAAVERAGARAWIESRADAMKSATYRRTFLHDEPDNARILGRGGLTSPR